MTPKFLLNSSQIHELVHENKYDIPKDKFTSRCIDGRYENSPNLPALAIPGADIGDLAALYATATQYAFEINYDLALQTLQEVVGKDMFSWHTDEHADANVPAGGCGHMKQIRLDPKAFNLEANQIEILDKQLQQAQKEGGKQTVLKGDHHEGAVLLVHGQMGVLPQYTLQTDNGKMNVQVFMFHQTLVNERHRVWVKQLLEKKAVTLFDNLDEEYLYEVLSSTTEDHLFEIAKRLAKGLPIFDVQFKDDGTIVIEERGFV